MSLPVPANGGISNPTSQPITRTNSFNNLRISADNVNPLARSTTKKIGNRKDPQREFFEMTVLAYQIRNQKKSPSIMKINRSDLYHECVKTKKGFEEWPEWIEQRVTKILINDAYSKKKKTNQARAEKLKKRLSTKIELHGEIKVDDSYFK